jgi:UDP-glucose 4-epimerase
VVAKFIKQALNRETLTIYGDGTQTRDFIFIDDLIDAVYRAAVIKNDIGGETFQIATSRETNIDEITGLLLDVLKANGIGLPRVEKTAPRLGDVKRNFSDTTKAKTMLGWRNEWSLKQGIEHTVQWFLNQGGPK